MAETIEKSQLIDINGLKSFLAKTDERYVKQGEGIGVTYTLSKNSSGEIVLTGSDSSETKVTDENTTYGFTQNGTVLTITPSTGDPITINMGEEITSEKIVSALGFTPVKASDIPTSMPASDVKDWAKADTKPTYTASEVGALPDTTDLSIYSLATEAGYDLGLSIDSSTYVMTLELKNKAGTVLSTKTLDFPIESMVVNASYANGKITLTLQSGTTLDVDISALVSGLVNDSFTIAGIDMKDNITVAELKTALGVPDSFAPTNAQANVIETVKVNGTALTPSNKAVDITIPTYSDLTETEVTTLFNGVFS